MKKSLAYGLLCIPIGLAVGIHLTVSALGDGYNVFIIAAPLAILLTGMLCWKIIMARLTYPRALLTGLLTGTLSHWLCWYMLLFIFYFIPSGTFSDRINPLKAIEAAAIYSFYSILFYGLFTAGLSAAAALFPTKRYKEISK